MDPVIIDVEDYLESIGVLKHYGTPRHSGRYPWGSGGNVEGTQRNKAFLGYVNDLKREGLTEAEIARGMHMTTTELRAAKSIAKNAQKAADITMVERLAAKGYSNVAIGQRLGMPESSVRALRADGVKDKVDVLHATANVLKDKVDSGAYVDVGTGVEHQLGVSRQKLDTAVALLKQQGYSYQRVQVDQLGTTHKTTLKVLAPPGTTYRDIVTNRGNIQLPHSFSEDGGRTYMGIKPPLSINSKRVKVNYAEDGGDKADGVIFVRPGVHDVSIGNARYAQVRIAVDGSHYLKGMAIYKDDLPDGVDLVFNTNKSNTGNKLDAMKAIKDDPDNPFGATIRQRLDPHTGMPTSVMNIVGHKEGSGEEGSWDTWSRNLSSQFLSKQSPELAKEQLAVTHERKRDELEGIMRLTNPAVKKKLLEAYAESSDSSAVHLKAAALPRQSTHVILPLPAKSKENPRGLADNEVYAPNFHNGERVVLVRYPHGGTFEIPELTVNNNHPPGKKLLGRATDAIGINHKVAERLSGADFDGDTVLVIPNNHNRVKSTPALEKLKDFDPKREYPGYPGMKVMDARTKGFEMGDVSNLITDMTIKGASQDELAHAVKHSMVVIDAEKHKLNWKQSAIDNNIKGLKQKYQQRADGSAGGASTLISRASARQDVHARKLRSPKDGGAVDPRTGKLVYTPTGESWQNAKGKTVFKTQRSTKLAETDDAHSLVSINGGTKMEKIYADHSNRMKDLANKARLEALRTKPVPYSPSAKKAFDPQVKSLSAKLTRAERNRPLERQAQVIANARVQAKRQANPDMGPDDLKKLKFQELEAARLRTGAKKELIDITPDEWAAIQAGAITNARLEAILKNADIDKVKQLATPKQDLLMTSTKTRRAKTMADLGYTQAEIAAALGVSLTTLKKSLKE